MRPTVGFGEEPGGTETGALTVAAPVMAGNFCLSAESIVEFDASLAVKPLANWTAIPSAVFDAIESDVVDTLRRVASALSSVVSLTAELLGMLYSTCVGPAVVVAGTADGAVLGSIVATGAMLGDGRVGGAVV